MLAKYEKTEHGIQFQHIIYHTSNFTFGAVPKHIQETYCPTELRLRHDEQSIYVGLIVLLNRVNGMSSLRKGKYALSSDTTGCFRTAKPTALGTVTTQCW